MPEDTEQKVCAGDMAQPAPDDAIARVAEGAPVPADLDGKERAHEALARAARLLVPVSCVIVAAARRDNFASDPAGWVRWARRVTGLDGSELHHRAAVGRLLLDLRDDEPRLYRDLFAADARKVLPLTRLRRADLPAFLSRHRVAAMSRDQVRAAVAEWLGEDAAPAPSQLALPGFEGFLDAIADADPADVARSVSTPERARKGAAAGLRMVAASAAYWCSEGDALSVQELRKALAECLAELDQASAAGG